MVEERNQISLIKIYLVRRTRFPKKVVVKAIVDICKDLFPAIEKIVKRNDWIFSQDGAPSHRSHLVQDFLKTELKRRFIRAEEWPPS